MPISVLVNDLIQARVYCYFQSQLSVNVCNYVATAVTPQSTIEDWALSYEALVAPRWRACIAKGALYHGIHATLYRAGQKFRSLFRNASQGVGTTTNLQALPKQTCGIITKLTDFGGPEGRGRLYVPFPYVDGTIDAVGPSNGQQVSMNAVAAVVAQPITVGSVGFEVQSQPVLINRKTLQRTNIIGSRTGTLWATQRRRGDYGRL